MLKERNAELREHQNKLFDSESKSRSIESEFARMRARLESEASLKEEAEKRNQEYERQLREVRNVTSRIADYDSKFEMMA